MKKRIPYIVGFFVLLFTEVLIALFVNDKFVRPYIGDVLVVVVIYCFVRCFLPEKCRWLPVIIFVFACMVEVLQYFRLVELLGVQDNTFLRVLIGSVSDIKDIVCYGVGCALLMGYEYLLCFLRKSGERST